jgi:hypothetical protein
MDTDGRIIVGQSVDQIFRSWHAWQLWRQDSMLQRISKDQGVSSWVRTSQYPSTQNSSSSYDCAVWHWESSMRNWFVVWAVNAMRVVAIRILYFYPTWWQAARIWWKRCKFSYFLRQSRCWMPRSRRCRLHGACNVWGAVQASTSLQQ